MRVPTITSAGSEGTPSATEDLSTFISSHRVDMSKYESIRRHIHSHPELSRLESATGTYIASHLHDLGYREIHTSVGGHGVAAVLRNGSGPTILLRSDTDALPVRERTGLPYASTKHMEDTEGNMQPVMHACGHDVHMTCLLATAETLIKHRSHWSGTLELIFQPAEEQLAGARAMVADGLFTKLIPVPDVLLGQHVFPERAGWIGSRAGPAMAATDSLKVTFYGRGAHASQPQDSIDVVVMATAAVQRLQGIVSREVAPLDTAVVTVAAIHAGAADNVIVDEAFIKINVRSFRKDTRDRILASIRRIVSAEARASGAEREPLVETIHSGPTLVNDKDVWTRLSGTFRAHFGDEFEPEREPIMGSEDFGILATSVKKPCAFWFFGGTDPEKYDKAIEEGRPGDIPTNHSPFFGPIMQPTLTVGIDAMVAAALTFLGKKGDEDALLVA